MSSYTPPTSSGIDFDFTADGYIAPSASGLEFSFDLRPTYSDTSDLGATLVASAVSGSVDLSAFARAAISGSLDLDAYLQTIPPADLPAFVRPTYPSYKNLGAAIRRIDKENPADLGGNIQSFTTRDLTAFIGTHLPADLGAAIKAWYRENIKNLGAEAIGEFFKGSADIAAWIGMHPPVNLGALLHGYAILDLQGIIASIYKADLPAFIQSTSLKNLNAIIQCVEPANLQGLIHGWDERFLPAEITGVYGPYDLQAYLRVHPYLDLPAKIHGWYSGIKDLQGIVEGYYVFDLGATISAIQAVNLGAILNAIGKAVDLPATIIPNVVRLKQAIQVILLEHKDLKALVNFQCVSSGYKDLGAFFETIFEKLDLPAFVWGWKTADKYGNLQAYINTAIYSVEDKLDIRFVPDAWAYTQLRVRFSVTDKYTVFDTQPIFYGAFFTKSLGAYIYAMPRSVDLGAVIEPVLQTNYTELPDYINPKSNVVVINFKDKFGWAEDWRKFVEIMFRKDGPAPYHYFYVSGTNKVYKIDRSRHWTVWATSYDKNDESMFERFNVRTKFIFNMRNYSKVDEAIRDLIDRVSAYREADLTALVNCINPFSTADLGASVFGYGEKRRWAKVLGASLTCVLPEYHPPPGDAADIDISEPYSPPGPLDADMEIIYPEI